MFRKLLIKIILERAIAFEEGAYRFYEEALERSAMSDTSELLRKLLAGELLAGKEGGLGDTLQLAPATGAR